jgi:hypothetical protein
VSGSYSLTAIRRSRPIAELSRREQPKERAVNLTKTDLEAGGTAEKNAF